MRPAPTVCCHVPREERRLVGTALRHAEFSWSWHSEGAPHRVMPSDTTELLFVEPAGVLLVAGPSWGPRRAAPLEATMFGVRLRASVHWRVLGLEPRELKDELVLAESLPGLRPLARRVSGLSAASALRNEHGCPFCLEGASLAGASLSWWIRLQKSQSGPAYAYLCSQAANC